MRSPRWGFPKVSYPPGRKAGSKSKSSTTEDASSHDTPAELEPIESIHVTSYSPMYWVTRAERSSATAGPGKHFHKSGAGVLRFFGTTQLWMRLRLWRVAWESSTWARNSHGSIFCSMRCKKIAGPPRTHCGCRTTPPSKSNERTTRVLFWQRGCCLLQGSTSKPYLVAQDSSGAGKKQIW